MNQQLLQGIMKSFYISEETLKEREEVSSYIHSVASLVIDRFYEHLMTSTDVSAMIDINELPRLKRMRTDTIIALFSDPLDEQLIKKLEKAFSDTPIRMDRFVVASVFETLTEAVVDIASVNTQLQKNLRVVVKFLRIAEFIMQQNLVQTENKTVALESDTSLQKMFESLYIMLMFHKEKNENLEAAYEQGDVRRVDIDLPIDDAQRCPFTSLTHKLEEEFKDKTWLYKDLTSMKDLHAQYHKDVEALYTCAENKDQEALEKQMQKIEKTSSKLFETLSKPFETSASLTFLTVKSGMGFLKQYGSILNEVKYIPYNNKNELLAFVDKLLSSSLQSSLSWALKEYHFCLEKSEREWEIEEVIPLHNCTLYMYIDINELPYKNFITDTLNMFLEVFKITLMNKEKEYTLTVLADRAESANRSKDMFLANMSHELRTPLNAIIGFSQILQTKSEIPDTLKAYIEKISIAGNNLLNIVNTILDFAKLEAGKISFHPQMVLLSSLIREIMVITSPLASAKNITIKFPSEVSLGLFIDEQLIKQVLTNLLSNAIKFTPNDGEISLQIKFNAESKCYVFSVCDNGIGMSKEEMAKLFQPFSQIDNDLQVAAKGTGLGLVITKRIVEDLHKGKVWVESEPNKGSCFYFSLPVSSEHSKVEIFPSKNDKAKDLLIVEDAEEYVDIFVEELNPYFNVTVTNSIEKAKELLEQKSYYRMVLDFFLTDGISSDLLSFMEYENIKLPTYMISAEDDFMIVEHIQESQNVVGIFNKKDARLVCEQITKG